MAAPSPAAALDAVDFCFMSRDEVRAISVRRIENESTFDSMLNPVPGGLYDTALGSWGDSPCSTCSLKTNCPGHPGHVELLVPLYHPIFMDQAFRLLRAQCLHCHGFRMAPRQLNLVACKLRLLRFGLVREAQLVAGIGEPDYGIGEKDVPDQTQLEAEEDGHSSRDPVCVMRDQYVRRAIREHVESGGHKTAKHEGVGDARRQVIKDFMADAPAVKKCHCGGISPSYRKNGWVKIFEMALSLKDKQAMAERNMKLVDAMARTKMAEEQQRDSDEGVADMDIDDTAEKGIAPKQRYIDSMEVRGRLQLLFDKEQDLLSLIYRARPPTRKNPLPPVTADMFFLQTLLVPPNRYRPEAKMADQISEAQQNNLYKNILRHNNEIARYFRARKASDDPEQRTRIEFQLHQAWVDLQGAVNSLIDTTKNPVQGAAAKRNEEGIKQKLEKKEGLFRMNMMGKRVNYAARSVISPDPNLETNEIGVPPVFASKLTYPEPVTTHNFRDMQQAVINGPLKWPGASAVEMENGRLVSLRHKSTDERVALANQLLTPSNVRSAGAKNKRVYRHLTNGDVVLMNRQPSLHRPSIMGHRVRVLPGEKTLRMHYANCNTYNADFDGDEMNMHFPQNELARVEALQVADTDHQYISTTQGAPLRGLIQDHISVAVDLCGKDSFFDRATYNQLVYSALRPENGHTTTDRLILLEPAILRPVRRWTGKQVITTILRNIQPPECGGVWMSAPTKIPSGEWGSTGAEEGVVEFQNGYFVKGILDKSHIGPSSGGLVHAVHEVYGPTIAGKLLSSLGRLLTRHLNTRAFSCGMDDLRLTPHGEARRRELLTAASRIGLETAAGYVSLADRPDDPELQVRLEEVMRDDAKQEGLDRLMNGACDKVKDSVNKELMPGGLVKKFPANRMQTMTVSGAKGSKVNATLISCSLGQQVLEGRRVPLMVSGKSLPCFDPFETHARAGGFVVNRFLTGIRPQEYYFHTMTGREGLIDTAVKTSRSGYLQRCLIKGMEGLTVSYDSTVRDSDGSLVQFLFGEDGIDVSKTKYLTDFSFVLRNWKSGSAQLKLGPEVFDTLSENRDGIVKHQRSAIKHARAGDPNPKDPANSLVNPARFAFATSESFFDAMTTYMRNNPDGLVREKGGRDSIIKAGAAAVSSTTLQIPKKMAESLLAIKFVRGQVEPGEAVGIVAGQSVGEPSTQMTLNTFHLAGHSGKNVTLGIPRLREILMTARRTISTPSMTLHMRDGVSEAQAEAFAKSISVLPLANLLDSAKVRERVGAGINSKGGVCRLYDVSLNLFPSEEYGAMYAVSVQDVMRAIETRFMLNLTTIVRREIKKRKAAAAAVSEIGVSVGTIEMATGTGDDMDVGAAAGEDGDDDEDSDHDNDATSAKQKSKRSEAVSYGPNDDDDDDIMRANQSEDEDDDEGLGGSVGSLDDEEDGDATDEAVAMMRGLRVTQKFTEVTRFAADEADGAWVRFTLEYDMASTPKILLLNMVQKAVRATLVHEVPGIKTCTHVPAQDVMGKPEPAYITVDGINFSAIHQHASSSSIHDPLALVDANTIQTNDIYAVLCNYGVEACRGAIVAELAGVFLSHGITVDNRHLNLIADYMTRGGGFEPFNRIGLKGNASPFSKMSFETTVGFLKDAVLDGDWDELRNPSSQLVMGSLARVGTGTFDVVPSTSA